MKVKRRRFLLDEAKGSPCFNSGNPNARLCSFFEARELKTEISLQQVSPAPNPPDIHVNEVQGPVVADPATMQFDGGVAQLGRGHTW